MIVGAGIHRLHAKISLLDNYGFYSIKQDLMLRYNALQQPVEKRAV